MSPPPPQSAEDSAALGRRLRELRKARRLPAREVAERAGVSPAYLSRLENGKVSPTVSTLTRVVQAMDESIARLFADGDTRGPVVRRNERRLVHHRGVDDYLLTPSSAARLEILETVIEPGATSGTHSYEHPGDEECILLMDGQLRVWVDDAEYLLHEGDAITFPCRVPHRWENPGETSARALWIITPPSY